MAQEPALHPQVGLWATLECLLNDIKYKVPVILNMNVILHEANMVLAFAGRM